MKYRYYSLPLRLDEAVQGRNLQQCSVEESIGQHIHLLITTAFGEIEYDPRFGCVVWDMDFDNLTAVNRMRDGIKGSVISAIQQYEPRLTKVSAEVYIQQELTTAGGGGTQAKKRVTLVVTGIIQSTHQPFSFKDSFYSGPLSYN